MKNEFFESSDISLVAALCCLGFHLDTIDKTNPKRAIFIVRRDQGLDEVIQRFWSHAVLVDPMAYFGALKEIKTRLYQN